MSRAELLALAERVEALNGADDVVNEAIALLIRGQCDWPLVLAPRFTASLDAAMGLYMDKPDVISTCPRKVCADALRQRAEVLGKGPEGRAQ